MSLTRKRVWVVDDSPLARETSARQLAELYEVEVFAHGTEVIERAASGPPPDVLVLDWVMPSMSGSEVLRFLRLAPATEGLPILVLTGTANGADLVEALDAGADDYVAKPCAGEELKARVGSLVRAKMLRDRAETAERTVGHLLVRESAARADAESANRVKDEFLATLSHELRTPLNSILGWTTLLRGGTLTPETEQRALATIERNAKAQAAIIEDLLDISRIVSGKLRLDLAEVDPTDSVEQAVETVRPTAVTKNVTLRSRFVRAPRVTGDASRIQQIVWNLLTNAIRFTPADGTIDVIVEPSRGGVRIAVADSGEGIAADLLPRVFDRFKQGDSTNTRTHGGLGLGLAIVRHLAQLHGGTASASSEGLGRGARFEVWLPSSSLPETARPSIVPARPEKPLTGLTILLVDDDRDSLDVLSAALMLQGATVSPVSSARAALTTLDSESPSVIVSDIMMPEMDGYSLMRAIRGRQAAQGGTTPAIALTAAAREEDRSKAMDAGFQMHLSKPIDMWRLSSAIVALTGHEAQAI